ncbi:MAG: hypothetical protein P4M02_04295 [Clostridia bacterium]|nr:hypothetical protein [Clostridia bacterium]
MMIKKGFYKDVDAIEVKTEKLSALFLPQLGGKLCSLKTAGGLEFMAENPGESYQALDLDGSFVATECAGFDDMLPTIDPCTITLSNGQSRYYYDHGEVCRVPWSAQIDGDHLVMGVRSPQDDYFFQKTVHPSGDGAIQVDYSVENLTDHELPFLYAAHFMLQAHRGAVIGVPDLQSSSAKLMFSSAGSICRPGELIPKEKCRDILRSEPFDANADAYKYYLLEALTQGVFTYRFDNVAFSLEIDQKVLKYMGVWINNGNFKGMYNIAFEPCTAPLDSPQNAAAAGYEAMLPAKGKLGWFMKFDFSTVK